MAFVAITLSLVLIGLSSSAADINKVSHVSTLRKVHSALKKPMVAEKCTVSTTISYTNADGSTGSATFSSTSASGCGAANSTVQSAVSIFFKLCGCS
jgi:hypothetical protein